MVRWIIAAAALPIAAPAGAQGSYANPILFADYSDPDVTRVGDDYYLVASSFHFSPGLPVLHSRDLIHWTIIGHVLPRLPFGPEYDMSGPQTLTDAVSKPIGGTRYGRGVWAPAIRHHAGKFYVYWPTPDEGVFMATASNPAGPWSKPVTVIAGAGYEDPCPFWDDDGSAWLIHGRTGAGPLILHRMSGDGTRVLDEGVVVAEDRVKLPTLEGPKLYKRNGWYYIFAPIGGVSTGPQAVGRARDIRGPYEWQVVLAQGSTAVQAPHQGGYVETPDGRGWFAHFNSTGAFGRIVYLEPVRWADGWPVMGDAGQPVARFAMPAPAAVGRVQDSDEFSSRRLGLQWSWNHNPVDRAWSLSERSGWLRLRGLPAEHLVTARNTLTQILWGPSSRITARVDVSHLVEGQRAGLSLFGVGPSWIGVTGGHVTLGDAGAETALAPRGGHRVVVLRADVRADQSVRYSYSLDGRHFVPAGQPVQLAQFSWWKGSRPALFSFTRGKGQGWVDVDWVHVERGQLSRRP
jgi:beta-xylosidase